MRSLTVEEVDSVGGGNGNDDFMTNVAAGLVAAAVYSVVVSNPVAVVAGVAIVLLTPGTAY
jgi:hypothetical protein